MFESAKVNQPLVFESLSPTVLCTLFSYTCVHSSFHFFSGGHMLKKAT